MKVMNDAGELQIFVGSACVSANNSFHLGRRDCAKQVIVAAAALVVFVLLLGWLIEYRATVRQVLASIWGGVLWIATFGNSFWATCVTSTAALMLWAYGGCCGASKAKAVGASVVWLSVFGIYTTFDGFDRFISLSVHQILFFVLLHAYCAVMVVCVLDHIGEYGDSATDAQRHCDRRNQALFDEVTRKSKEQRSNRQN